MTTTAHCANSGHTQKHKHLKSLHTMTSQSLKCPDVQNLNSRISRAASFLRVDYVVEVAMSILECHMPIDISRRQFEEVSNSHQPKPARPGLSQRELAWRGDPIGIVETFNFVQRVEEGGLPATLWRVGLARSISRFEIRGFHEGSVAWGRRNCVVSSRLTRCPCLLLESFVCERETSRQVSEA